MKELKDCIHKQGRVINEHVLKVDSFLNHQIDPVLMKQIGEVFYEYFKDHKITKVVTIESSGIAPSVMCALQLNVPLVFVKKTHPSTMEHPLSADVHSFTKNKNYTVCIDSEYICKDDRILFIDDFLANGEAFKGVEEIIKQTTATIVGVGIIIEKAFQQGHHYILEQGYDLKALASIASLDDGKVSFQD